MGTSRAKATARTKQTRTSEAPAASPAAPTGQALGGFYGAGPALSLAAQPKLVVGRSGDPFEREADAVADSVSAGRPAPALTPVPPGGPRQAQPLTLQRQASADHEQGESAPTEEDEPDADLMQRQAGPSADDAPQQPEEPLAIQACGCDSPCSCGEHADQQQALQRVVIQARTINGATGPGQGIAQAVAAPGAGEPLRPGVRRSLEHTLGVGLGDVRIHNGVAEAHALRARAFTHGSDIWLGRGESPDNLQLMAHEAAHVVQQGAVDSAPLSTHRSGAPLVQRAEYTQFDGVDYLLLLIPFGAELIYHEIALQPDVNSFFAADDGLAQRVEDQLGTIFNPPGRPLHETLDYLESPAVTQLIVRGLRQLPASGRADFSELAGLLQRRTALYYEQNLLPGTSDYLAGALGIDPVTIDWNALIPALRAEEENAEPTTVIDASLHDRYMMFLDMLANEAAALPAVLGAAAIDATSAGDQLWRYLINRGAELFSADVFAYHSEKFVGAYMPLLEAVRYVPAGFDLEAFRPSTDTSRIDAARERIVATFIAHEAESRVLLFILDRWTESGDDPETFLADLDLEEFRDDITSHLAEELIIQARSDPDLMAALRSRAADQARFTQVSWLVGLGHTLEAHNAGLASTFLFTPLDQLSPEDAAIAADPYAYYDTSLQVSGALRGMFDHLTANGPVELETVRAAAAALQAIDMPAGYAPLFLLPELLGYIAALQRALEQQVDATQQALEDRLDLDFERIATVVRSYVEQAERYVRETWIPMLKRIAIKLATENRDELKYQDENWEAIRSSRTLGFAAGAAELNFMAAELESGRSDAIEVDGQLVRRDGAPHLRNAARMLRAAGLEQLDDDAQSEKHDKLRGAVADYDQVIADIQDGTYDPLDYSQAVYDLARQRLGLVRMEGVTVGMVLTRTVVAARNPFLEYAVVRWHFKEGLERDFRRAAVLFGMGLLTVAAALVPGAVGVVLGVVDAGLGIYNAVQGVGEARATLRMARLDIHGTIVGVSEADAERALRHAWINLGVTLLLTAGVAALQAHAFLRRPGGVRVPRSGRAVGVTSTESRLLAETAELHGSQLRPQQLSAEAQVAARSPSRPSTLRGFEEEITLPNDHTWRRQGTSWCRFSTRPFCMPSSTLPPALRRSGYRDVARTIDEGLDATGAFNANRGHSFADHGAQTTPAQHRTRLNTGVTPGGSTRAVPASSSRFATHRAHLDAYQMALDDLGANYLRTRGTPRAGYTNTLTLGGVGKSYTLGAGGVLMETTVSRFTFYFERNAHGWYDLITMYPVP